MTKLKKQMQISERSFYATLACFFTCLINLFYYLVYSKSPLTLVAILPLIFWVAYDGNEEGKITKLGYWYWVSLLTATSLVTLIYPLF